MYISQFVNKNGELMKFFKNTHCPDEMVFQTILGNSPFRATKRRHLTFTDWSAGNANPAPINDSHVELFLENRGGEVLFCRKVVDAHIVDKLEQMLQSRARSCSTDRLRV